MGENFSDTKNTEATLSGTSSEIVKAVSSKGLRRTQLIIINTSAAAVVTLRKGSLPVISKQGIILNGGINAPYLESTDSGFTCWQGAVQAITDGGAGTASIVETFEYTE